MTSIIDSKSFRTSFLLACLCLIFCSFYYFEFHKTKMILLGLIFCVIIVIASLIANLIKPSETQSLKVFAFVFLSLGIFSASFFPAGSIPDETFHFDKSYSYWVTLSEGDFTCIRTEDLPLIEPKVFLNDEISENGWGYSRDHFLDPSTSGYTQLSSVKDYDSNRICKVDLISELPQLKLPSALGIGFGVTLGLNHVLVFYLGRIFNFLFSAALVIAAINYSPAFKNSMMVAALFPMTLHLMGSYSYDAPTIGFAFLFTSLVFRVLLTKESVNGRLLLAVVVVGVLLAPCKAVYGLIALPILLVPSKYFRDKRSAFVFKLALVGSMLAAMLVLKLASLTSIAGSATSVDVRGTETGHFWSLGEAIANPLASFYMLIRSFEGLGSFWVLNIPGKSLGWFQPNTSLPDLIPISFIIIFIISALRSKDDSVVLDSSIRTISIVAILISSLGIIASMWFGWTFISENMILGVQGRYFIPLLPLTGAVIRSKHVFCDCSLWLSLILVACTLCAISFMHIACYAV